MMIFASLSLLVFSIIFATLKGFYHREYLGLKPPGDELDYSNHPEKRIQEDLSKQAFGYRYMLPLFKIPGNTPRDKTYKKILAFTSAMTVLGVVLLVILIIYQWLY